MYRDDPPDDEDELRGIVGDAAVDTLAGATTSTRAGAIGVALDALRVLQGWVDDAAVARWFHQPQRRLDGRSPIEAIAAGLDDEVLDAARRWAAAQG